MFRTIHRLALVALAVALTACGTALDLGDGGSESTTTTMDATTTTTVVPDGTTTTVVVTTTTEHEEEPTPPPTGDTEVVIFLVGGPEVNQDGYDCGAVSPVVRYVDAPAVLTGAMKALLAGPTAEELDQGYDSWFREDTGWTVASIDIVDGVAYIDFAEDSPFINNASTSCGSFSFLAQLDKTATQFPTIDHAVYSIGGDARVFYEWLQRDVPRF